MEASASPSSLRSTMTAIFFHGGPSSFHPWALADSSPRPDWKFYRASSSGSGSPQQCWRPSGGSAADSKRRLPGGGEAAHEFLLAGEEVAQAGAGGTGFNAALHLGEFLLGLAMLE